VWKLPAFSSHQLGLGRRILITGSSPSAAAIHPHPHPRPPIRPFHHPTIQPSSHPAIPPSTFIFYVPESGLRGAETAASIMSFESRPGARVPRHICYIAVMHVLSVASSATSLAAPAKTSLWNMR